MNGVIIIDKPSGKTSYAVVENIKRILGVRKVGHTGTLDPLATGVLPVCINEATKLVQFFLMDSKEYRATMLLGIETDTLDIEGKITARKEPCVIRSNIEAVLSGFVGKIEQTPPRYSAVKYKGKPMYKWARKGHVVDPLPRMVEVHQITLEDVELPYVTFSVSCSKGTYIRSLCSDIGEKLGCGACLSALRRIKSGHFLEESAISFENVHDQKKVEILTKNLIPMIDALSRFPAIDVDQKLAGRLRNGYQPVIGDMVKNQVPVLAAGDVVKFVSGGNCLVALARKLYSFDQISSLDSKEQLVEIIRVFNC
ncbi:MAG: tRNA pseudouridine(55) synthase TruB [Thermodesulfobacteriota bacterium]|nr:tRNA pseudouridine(55) synthase TruB [Thermodesulfobacteriota bacterium]